MVSPLILAPLGEELGADEAAFFRDAAPWGFILFSRNLRAPDQIRRLTNAMRDAIGRDAPVLIDQEGGRVQRLRPPLARDWRPPLEDVVRLGHRAAQGLSLRYRIIAAELLALGIDVNCAPVLDIAGDDTHPFLRNRCLGTRKSQVAALGQVAAGGLLEGGVLPVIKHMPGHGRGKVDSHLELPRSDVDLAVLEAEDFAPFAALAEMPMAMTAHLVLDAIDPDKPATQSPAVISLIRERIGFEGLLMSDDISMQALKGPVAERACAAWEAGCDMVLHCNGDLAEMQALANAAPKLGPASRKRANAALAMRVTPPPSQIDALIAEYEAL